jgi:mannose-6-phosphate isomerase-like protein (cupin superfamily)
MATMKATCNIPSFPFARSILHIASDGGAFCVQPPFTKAELAHLDGRVLATFPLSTPADAHPDIWEMHPAADEVLFMLSGELQVEYSDGVQGGTALLKAGEGLVMPQGVWHRLILREPGLLQALTAPRGTESRPHAGGRP